MLKIFNNFFKAKKPKDIFLESVEYQERHLAQRINNLIKNLQNFKKPTKKIGVFSDTHGDIISLLGSLIESDIIFLKENAFTYYELGSEKFFTKEEYEKLKSNKKLIFSVFPTVFINNEFNGEIYHLGDLLDRGSEGIASLLFMEQTIKKFKEIRNNISPVYLAIGNHESHKNNKKIISNQKIQKILVRMLKENNLSTGFVKGKENEAIALWHTALIEEDLKNIIDILFNPEDDIIETIKTEIENTNEKLRNKIKNKEKNFSKEELARIKIIVGNAILKKNIYNNKNNFVNDDCKKLMKQMKDTKRNCIFSNEKNYWNKPVLSQFVGHDKEIDKTLKYEENGNIIIDIDVARTAHYRNGKSAVATFYFDGIDMNDVEINAFEIASNGNINFIKIKEEIHKI